MCASLQLSKRTHPNVKVFKVLILEKVSFENKQNQRYRTFKRRSKSFSKVYLQNIITYMISATQEVNHVLSSVGCKLCHYFITNPHRLVIGKKIKSGFGLQSETERTTDYCGEYSKKGQTR